MALGNTGPELPSLCPSWEMIKQMNTMLIPGDDTRVFRGVRDENWAPVFLEQKAGFLLCFVFHTKQAGESQEEPHMRKNI